MVLHSQFVSVSTHSTFFVQTQSHIHNSAVLVVVVVKEEEAKTT